jgi:hypothetical protein
VPAPTAPTPSTLAAVWRRRALGVLLLIGPLGVWFAEYAGPGRWWFNNGIASVCYELFFILIAFLVWPGRGAVRRVPVIVCLATIALEFLQLWQPAFLQTVRATWAGQAVLGNAFAWSDLPAYPLGCLLGWLLLRRIVGVPLPADD